MKLISWNVNGLRACLQKGFAETFSQLNADIFCIQETKMQAGQAEFAPSGYFQYWNYAVKKGYSGTAVFTKYEPLSVTYGIGNEVGDSEGRAITLEFPQFYLLNVYTPNSQRELARLAFRMEWEDNLRSYITKLSANKPVIYCGDLNVAHNEIDLKNPKTNRQSAGFSDEEREKMTLLLQSGFVDSYRYLYPDKVEYSWWSYMRQARDKNIGWRIDYFITSDTVKEKINDSFILGSFLGSDHCPVGIEIDL